MTTSAPAAPGTAAPPAASAPAASGLLLVVLCGAHFMDAIDLSYVTVALPAVQRDLGLGTGPLGWVVSAYLLGYGGFLLLGGRAADVLGRRRTFLSAVAVFGAVSIVAVAAPSGTVLVAARLVKGVAAGFLAPSALALITSIWPEGERRGRALGAYATAGAAGFVGGLVLGGLATELSWRVAFALPLPFAAAVLLLAPRLVPAEPTARRTAPLDAPGAALATGGFVALVGALTEAPGRGWTAPLTLGLLAVAAFLLGGFVLRERATAEPLLPLGFLRRRGTAGSAATIALLWAAYTGFAYLATLALQDGLGWSALATGLAFAPIGLINGPLAPTLGRIATRVGPRRVVALGMTLLTASYALFLPVGPGADYPTAILPIMVLNGLGIACTFAPLNVAALTDVPEPRLGLAASLLGAAQQLGGAIGLAVVAAMAAGTGAFASSSAAWTVVALSAVGVGATLVLPGRSGPVRG
ncbi:MFS transporter [Patulibacter sp. S7RM1-6]